MSNKSLANVPMKRVFGSSRPGVVWRGLDVLAENINRRGKTLNRTRRNAMDRLAEEMETWAAANAPWKNRTFRARTTLEAFALHDEANYISTAYISHGVPYGIFLETMNSGQYAIIEPTIQHFSGRFLSRVVELDSFDGIFNSMYGGD